MYTTILPNKDVHSLTWDAHKMTLVTTTTLHNTGGKKSSNDVPQHNVIKVI